MASTRLPGKVLADLAGRPLLYHVVNRTSLARTLNSVVVATTVESQDDPIEEFCDSQGVLCFRGSENDVLDRYYQAAKYWNARVVVRITADCPLLDPAVIDEVVAIFNRGPADYVTNTIECTYPDGLDTEVFNRQALARAWREARLKSEREHVTPYIRNHPELFRLGNVSHSEDLSALRWTVDEPNDLAFVREIYDQLGTSMFGMEEVLKLLREHPGLSEVNRGIMRNEGYLKSLRDDVAIKQAEAK